MANHPSGERRLLMALEDNPLLSRVSAMIEDHERAQGEWRARVEAQLSTISQDVRSTSDKMVSLVGPNGGYGGRIGTIEREQKEMRAWQATTDKSMSELKVVLAKWTGGVLMGMALLQVLEWWLTKVGK